MNFIKFNIESHRDYVNAEVMTAIDFVAVYLIGITILYLQSGMTPTNTVLVAIIPSIIFIARMYYLMPYRQKYWYDYWDNQITK